MRLQAPLNCDTTTVQGHLYEVGRDGTIEITDFSHLADLRSHGFTDYVEPKPSDDGDTEPAAERDEFSRMNRLELFAWAREHNLRMPTPINIPGQRAACRAHKRDLLSGELARQEAEAKEAEKPLFDIGGPIEDIVATPALVEPAVQAAQIDPGDGVEKTPVDALEGVSAGVTIEPAPSPPPAPDEVLF